MKIDYKEVENTISDVKKGSKTRAKLANFRKLHINRLMKKKN
jgi:hypothetical protein